MKFSMNDLQVNSIENFYKANSRAANDASNRLREAVFEVLNYPDHEFYKDIIYGHRWQKLLDSFRSHISEILSLKGLSTEFKSFKLEHRGNLQNHHDFLLTIYKENSADISIFWEFKFKSMPQFAQEFDKNRYIEPTLAEFWYDGGWLDKIIALYPVAVLKYGKPARESYLIGANHMLGKGSTGEQHAFYKQFYDLEHTVEYGEKSETYRKKQSIVDEGIRTYLEQHGSKFNFDKLKEKLNLDQKEKVYGLWNPQRHVFNLHEYTKEELTPTEFIKIKNGNSVVLKAGPSELHCLLRWKNTRGICCPAWQISMVKTKAYKTALTAPKKRTWARQTLSLS